MKPRRQLLQLISIPVFLTGMLFSCKNDIADVKALTEDQTLPVQSTFDVVYDYTEKGKIRNRLQATRLDRYIGEQPYIEVSGGFTMFIFDSLQQVEAELTANRGVFRESERVMEAYENVVLKNAGGDEMQTEELFWVQDSSLIYTNKFVKITREDGVLFGKGLVSNETFSKYRIKEPTGEINVELDSLKNP